MTPHPKGFTLIEVLISLSISTLIILGIMQTYRSSVRYLEGTRMIMAHNRTTCLLLNQLEKDLSTAYIPKLAPLEKTDDKNQQQAADSSDTKEKKADQEKEAARTSFIGQIDQRSDTLKINNKKLMPLKLVSFITTSPLEVYGHHKPRLVRIVYQLSPNKGLNNGMQSFTLVRKETSDLKNTFAVENEEAIRKYPTAAITSHTVASALKFFSIEYTYKKKEKGSNGKEVKVPARSFTWGEDNKEDTHSVVPLSAQVYLQIWNDQATSWHEAHLTIPIFSYPTLAHDTKTTATAEANAAKNQSPLSPSDTTTTHTGGDV